MGNRLTILIVDDVAINREILKDIFKDEYKVVEAEDGLGALEVLRGEEHVDIILLDIIMPKMNGLEVLQIIKRDERLKRIPVIVNTQEGERAKEFKALEMGADDFIIKPYNPKIVRQRVTNLVHKYIKEKESMERKIRNTMNRLQSLIDTVPGGIAIFEISDGVHIEFFNDGLCELLGYSREEFSRYQTQDALELVLEEDQKILKEENNAYHENGSIHCKVRFLTKEHTIKWVGITAKKMESEEGRNVYHAVFMDSSEEKETEERLQNSMEELRYRAERDNLTGVYNRETFYRKTEQMLRENPKETFVIGQWNIDRFKVVNELMGSSAADHILRKFAQKMDEKLKGHGTFGRLEADHFVTCTTKRFIEQGIEYIEQMLAGVINWERIHYPIRMHVGFYLVEDKTTPVELMCDRADMALQTIKNNYLKRWCYYNDSLKREILDEEEYVVEMETALLEHQFVVYYQPIYDARTRKPVSAEALVRWQHPQKGMIPPDVFVPLFEKNGFITKLDMFVWEEACKFLAERKEQGKEPIPISVNLSRINFYNPNLAAEICALTRRYQVSPEYLRLEITESAYKDNPEEMLSTMKTLQEDGFKVLMDDFGSGYSSLNMLKMVPVDILKIDMKFIDDLENSERACNILYNIIQMTKGLKMGVIAEGIETQNQCELLFGMGCTYIQGFYFSKPLCKEDFVKEIECQEEKNFDYEMAGVKKQTILVVDDTELNRSSIMEMIKDKYRVLEAKNGEEALSILKKEFANINLVLSDIFMPKVSGFDLLEIMKRNDLLRMIPVLILTAFGDQENQSKALELGALDVITKPYDAKTLKKRIENLLQISENDSIKAEVHALRESSTVRKQVQSMLRNDVASICRMEISYKDFEIKRMVFANDKFMELHQIHSTTYRSKKNLGGFLDNIVEEDKKRLRDRAELALRRREKCWQNVYRIEGANGSIHSMISNCTMDFQADGIFFDTIEIEVVTKENFEFEKSLDMLSQAITKETNLQFFLYSLDDDSVDYITKRKNGSSRRVIQKRSLFQMLPGIADADYVRREEMYERIRNGKRTTSEEFHCVYTDEDTRETVSKWFRVTLSRMEGSPTEKRMALGVCEDITKDREHQICKWREQQYQAILGQNAFFFAEIDLADNRFISEKIQDNGFGLEDAEILSYDDFVEQRIEKLVLKDDIKYIDSWMRRTNLKKWFTQGEREISFDLRIMLPNKNAYEWFTSTVYMSKNPGNNHVCASWKIRNTEAEKKKLGKIRQMAERDSLTELYNRINFEKRVSKELLKEASQNKSRAFIMIDVDNFKQVNDSFGHDFGDIVLRAVAKILRSSFTEENIIGRLGGDEFAVFISKASSKKVILEQVQKVCAKISTTFENKGEKVSISCSIGVVYTPEEGKEFQILYEKADDALYQAKHAGKNQYKIFTN
ncbi:MAG: EAL domain-containing protein [Roseburia sp.]|nr:EAL domain-containing protein [Roseburia sp.]